MESHEYFTKIKRLVKDSDYEDSIHLLGPIQNDDVPYIISQSTIFVNSSIDESFCMPLLVFIE